LTKSQNALPVVLQMITQLEV